MLALRYLLPRRSEGFVSVISLISFLGITLGVATLIVVMAVLNGFRAELLDKILGFSGHATFYSSDLSPIPDFENAGAARQGAGRQAGHALCRGSGHGVDATQQYRGACARNS